MLHILMYLGFLLPGNYTTAQINTMLMVNQQQMAIVQTNPILSQQANQTSIVGVVVSDEDKNY